MGQLSLFEEDATPKNSDALKVIEAHNKQFLQTSKYIPLTPSLALDDVQAKDNAIVWIRGTLYQHQKNIAQKGDQFLKTLTQEALLKKNGTPSIRAKAALLTLTGG